MLNAATRSASLAPAVVVRRVVIQRRSPLQKLSLDRVGDPSETMDASGCDTYPCIQSTSAHDTGPTMVIGEGSRYPSGQSGAIATADETADQQLDTFCGRTWFSRVSRYVR